MVKIYQYEYNGKTNVGIGLSEGQDVQFSKDSKSILITLKMGYQGHFTVYLSPQDIDDLTDFVDYLRHEGQIPGRKEFSVEEVLSEYGISAEEGETD
jgi:hypothetical protein